MQLFGRSGFQALMVRMGATMVGKTIAHSKILDKIGKGGTRNVLMQVENFRQYPGVAMTDHRPAR